MQDQLPPADIGRRIHAARVYAQLTREELAAHLGMSKSTLRRIEKGERQPRLSDLKRIAECCHIPLWLLVEALHDRPPNLPTLAP